MPTSGKIVWPPHYDPANCPVHVHNELQIEAEPENIWRWLVRAQEWPSWYHNSANVRFLEGDPPDLGLGTRFKWRTFGVELESTVKEEVPYERLAWDAHGTGIDAFHVWLIERNEKGCLVITEETQKGFLARAQGLLLPNRMRVQHQAWLEGLREKALAGGTPGTGTARRS